MSNSVSGLCGLSNMGNTCYMNAVLQMLAHNIKLLSYFIRDTHVKDLTNNIKGRLGDIVKKQKGLKDDDIIEIDENDFWNMYAKTITHQLHRLVINIWKCNGELQPTTFKAVLGLKSRMFAGCSQNDSHEALNLILDQIHEETKSNVQIDHESFPIECKNMIGVRLKYKTLIDNAKTEPEKLQYFEEFQKYKNENIKEVLYFDYIYYWQNYVKSNYSVITQACTGLYLSNVKCSNCGNVTNTFEHYTNLSLPIPILQTDQQCNITDCIKTFSNAEMLNGQNQYECDCCGVKSDGIKKINIWNVPDVFIIHLKRFSTDVGPNKNVIRINKNPSFITYPFEHFDMFPYMHPLHAKHTNFNLVSVIHHYGSYGGGHYTATCKNPINSQWYNFNDSNVTHIPEQIAVQNIMSRDSYILTYVNDH